MDHQNVFKQAALIQLTTSCWIGSKTLQKGVMESLGNSQWLKGKKFLINPELLGAVKTTIHKARQVIQRHALPFPMTGLSLVPKDFIQDVDAELEYLKEEFQVRVDTFMDHYDGARDEAKYALGEHFDESDYPVDVKDKFRFEWRFLLLDVPGRASVLSPEIYEREKRKFQELMDEARELSIAALREEFGRIVTDLVDRFTGDGDGKPRTFRSDMTRKLTEFLDSFGDKNLFDDKELDGLVTQARTIVQGMDTPYALSYNATLRQRFSKDMDRLKQGIDKAIEDLPRRRIRFETVATPATSVNVPSPVEAPREMEALAA